uniref:RHEB like 1 n=1 Tax=Macaca fascicularis TaxID=9541 RepID=G7PHR9_MACFA
MSFTYTWWTQQGRMSTAFCPIHSSLESMVMCLCILSPLYIASRSLRVCTKSYTKAMGKPGCQWF